MSSNRILVVEDQEDVRQLLVTALELEGYEVHEAANAHDGLTCLRTTHYDLVLSDYAMPGGTGTWMLREATRLGRLHGTAALIVTAHPDAQELQDVPVIPKPLDLDHFLNQVREVLDDTSNPLNDGREAPSGHRVELVLYVSTSSPASIQARRNLDRVLEAFDARQVKCSVCDLGRDPMAGVADSVAFTPTLVKRYPEPKMWFLGNLRETELVADLLRLCGVDASR